MLGYIGTSCLIEEVVPSFGQNSCLRPLGVCEVYMGHAWPEACISSWAVRLVQQAWEPS
jgi:hypothetical protein